MSGKGKAVKRERQSHGNTNRASPTQKPRQGNGRKGAERSRPGVRNVAHRRRVSSHFWFLSSVENHSASSIARRTRPQTKEEWAVGISLELEAHVSALIRKQRDMSHILTEVKI